MSDGEVSAEDELESDGAAEERHDMIKRSQSPRDEKRKLKAPLWTVLSESGAGSGSPNGRIKPHAPRPVRPKNRHDMEISHVAIEGSSHPSSRLSRRLMLGPTDLDGATGRYVFFSLLLL